MKRKKIGVIVTGLILSGILALSPAVSLYAEDGTVSVYEAEADENLSGQQTGEDESSNQPSDTGNSDIPSDETGDTGNQEDNSDTGSQDDADTSEDPQTPAEDGSDEGQPGDDTQTGEDSNPGDDQTGNDDSDEEQPGESNPGDETPEEPEEPFTGLQEQPDGSWYYLIEGILQDTYTGLVKDTDGTWYYVENGIVKSCSRNGGKNGWQLFSISRWTSSDGKQLKKHLELEFEKNKNHQIYWDDIAIFCHANEYELGIYKMNPGDVIEIDNIYELARLDHRYQIYVKK